ncbi:hypothetical protein CEUSTIGMA_g7068.t1 [Chlamydomonas eustigma]|uniref:Gfd2/YDR514C-like C-terminal domain-containing protein n=1 Tax=Chlamydomonas eustigma TaxID=1157962 RepID=A0A250X991_9CHLO|nr:hypothetical protein CEUSTIGMA_g7068.t1 [Chlamydomonas eustigma]|eukprot:GAX79627.1 hypothetical protein CEUSTIGMA_g7068.t1 [Chlamydomonas eustigma]
MRQKSEYVLYQTLQQAWIGSQQSGRRKECVKAFFDGPSLFFHPQIQQGVFRGSNVKDRRQSVLLKAEAVQSLHNVLKSKLSLLPTDFQNCPSPQAADGDSIPLQLHTASEVRGGQHSLPSPDDLPPTAFASSDTFVDIVPCDVSDASKVLHMFKAVMKHNNDLKKSEKRQGRRAEVCNQLHRAQSMFMSCSSWRAAPETTATADEDVVEGLKTSANTLNIGGAECNTQPSVFVSVDLEWYERDQSRLLEIGWSCWDSVRREISSKHWIVEENLRVRNGRYVPDHRSDFRFGESILGSKKEGTKALQHDLEPSSWAASLSQYIKTAGGGGGSKILPKVAIVGHGMVADLKMLDSMGIVIPEGTEVIDTNSLAWALMGGSQVQHSLRSLLSWLSVPDVIKLHNGGNDARYTLEAALRMCQMPKP